MGDLLLGVVHRAKPGNTVSGDAWIVRDRENGWLVCVADGLGSGEPANRAASLAVRTAWDCHDLPLPEILTRCHHALVGTRGAAVAVLLVQRDARLVQYAGVGNIEARTRRDWNFHPLSLRGIVGNTNFRPPRVYEGSYEAGEWLVLHSDGLKSRFDLELELVRIRPVQPDVHPTQAVADDLAERFAREGDDVTLLVMQLP